MTIREEMARLTHTLDKTSNRVLSEELMDVSNFKYVQETSDEIKIEGSLKNVLQNYTQTDPSQSQVALYSNGTEKVYVANVVGRTWTQNDLVALKSRMMSVIKNPAIYIDSKNGNRIIIKSAPVQQPQQPQQPVQQVQQPAQATPAAPAAAPAAPVQSSVETVDEGIIDSIKGAAWQLKKQDTKNAQVKVFVDTLMNSPALKSAMSQSSKNLEYIRSQAETLGRNLLRWPDQDNFRHSVSRFVSYLENSGLHGSIGNYYYSQDRTVNRSTITVAVKNALKKARQSSVSTKFDY